MGVDDRILFVVYVLATEASIRGGIPRGFVVEWDESSPAEGGGDGMRVIGAVRTAREGLDQYSSLMEKKNITDDTDHDPSERTHGPPWRKSPHR